MPPSNNKAKNAYLSQNKDKSFWKCQALQCLWPNGSLMPDSVDISEENSTLRHAVGLILQVFLINLYFYMQWT